MVDYCTNSRSSWFLEGTPRSLRLFRHWGFTLPPISIVWCLKIEPISAIRCKNDVRYRFVSVAFFAVIALRQHQTSRQGLEVSTKLERRRNPNWRWQEIINQPIIDISNQSPSQWTTLTFFRLRSGEISGHRWLQCVEKITRQVGFMWQDQKVIFPALFRMM